MKDQNQSKNLEDVLISRIVKVGNMQNLSQEKKEVSRKKSLESVQIIPNIQNDNKQNKPQTENQFGELPSLTEVMNELNKEKNKEKNKSKSIVDFLIALIILVLLSYTGFQIFQIFQNAEGRSLGEIIFPSKENALNQNTTIEQKKDNYTNPQIQSFLKQMKENDYEVVQKGGFSYPNIEKSDNLVNIGYEISLNPDRVYLEKGEVYSLIYAQNQLNYLSPDSIVLIDNEDKSYIEILRNSEEYENLNSGVDSISGGFDSLKNEIPLSYLINGLNSHAMSIESVDGKNWNTSYKVNKGDGEIYETSMIFELTDEGLLQSIRIYSDEFDEDEKIIYEFYKIEGIDLIHEISPNYEKIEL